VLAGAAVQIVWDTGSQCTFYDVVHLLRARIGNERRAERLRVELRARSRQKGEILQSLHSYICRLQARAYTGPMRQLH
jgi:hypothetical protein